MPNLIGELAAEISSSNPSYSSDEISDQIVLLIENDVLPLAIERVRLPKTLSPLNLRIERFRRERSPSKKGVDELQDKAKFVQELEKLRRDYYFFDSTSESFQDGDAKDFNQPFIYPIEYSKRKKERALPETGVIRPKLEPKPFSDMPERELKKPLELVTFDSSISKKISSDPHFEKTIARLESRIRERFKDVPDIAFSFVLRQDVGDHVKEKTIIHIRIPNSNFREKMNYWLRIDFEVRKVIKALDFSDEERKVISRNLVTHVEPT